MNNISLFSKINAFLKLAQNLDPYYVNNIIQFFQKFNPSVSKENVLNWLSNNPQLIDKKFILNSKFNTIFLSSILKYEEDFLPTYFIISHDNSIKNFFDISEEGFITPSNNIPKLFFFIGTFSPQPFKNIDEFNFIASFLQQSIFYMSSYQINQFISDNIQNINKLTSQFKHHPIFIGKGADGFAFDIGNDKILKLFTNKLLFNNLSQTYHNLFSHPAASKTEIPIYDVGSLGPLPNNNSLFYVIIKKLQAVLSMENFDDKLINKLNLIIDYVEKDFNSYKKLFASLFNDKKFNKLKQLIEKKSTQLEYKIRNNPDFNKYLIKIKSNMNLHQNWLHSFIEEIITKLSSGRNDLHLGNLGISSQQELRFFDPFYQDDYLSKSI